VVVVTLVGLLGGGAAAGSGTATGSGTAAGPGGAVAIGVTVTCDSLGASAGGLGAVAAVALGGSSCLGARAPYANIVAQPATNATTIAPHRRELRVGAACISAAASWLLSAPTSRSKDASRLSAVT